MPLAPTSHPATLTAIAIASESTGAGHGVSAFATVVTVHSAAAHTVFGTGQCAPTSRPLPPLIGHVSHSLLGARAQRSRSPVGHEKSRADGCPPCELSPRRLAERNAPSQRKRLEKQGAKDAGAVVRRQKESLRESCAEAEDAWAHREGTRPARLAGFVRDAWCARPALWRGENAPLSVSLPGNEIGRQVGVVITTGRQISNPTLLLCGGPLLGSGVVASHQEQKEDRLQRSVLAGESDRPL